MHTFARTVPALEFRSDQVPALQAVAGSTERAVDALRAMAMEAGTMTVTRRHSDPAHSLRVELEYHCCRQAHRQTLPALEKQVGDSRDMAVERRPVKVAAAEEEAVVTVIEEAVGKLPVHAAIARARVLNLTRRRVSVRVHVVAEAIGWSRWPETHSEIEHHYGEPAEAVDWTVTLAASYDTQQQTVSRMRRMEYVCTEVAEAAGMRPAGYMRDRTAHQQQGTQVELKLEAGVAPGILKECVYEVEVAGVQRLGWARPVDAVLRGCWAKASS